MPKPTILNTRPTQSSQFTTDVFEGHGFAVINFPCIEISSIENSKERTEQLTKVSADDVVIFTSQHAVTFAYKIHPALKLTTKNNVIAVGTKTAQQLEQNTSADIWVPIQQNSQGVIELLCGLKNIKTIKLITAKNGRKEIQKFAESKAINLEQINVYQRQLPQVNKKILKRINQTKPLIILATSITTITNLQQLVSPKIWQYLQTCTIACASQRIAQEAVNQGFKNIINTNSANPELISLRLA